VTAGEGGVLGRPVAVDQGALWRGEDLERPRNVRHRERVASGEQLAQAPERRRPLVDDLVEETGGEPERGRPVARQEIAEVAERERTGGRQHEASAIA